MFMPSLGDTVYDTGRSKIWTFLTSSLWSHSPGSSVSLTSNLGPNLEPVTRGRCCTPRPRPETYEVLKFHRFSLGLDPDTGRGGDCENERLWDVEVDPLSYKYPNDPPKLLCFVQKDFIQNSLWSRYPQLVHKKLFLFYLSTPPLRSQFMQTLDTSISLGRKRWCPQWFRN